jgi:hypothetical protein
VAMPFYIEKYLKAKNKNYENSNISPCKNIIFQKNPPRKKTKILPDIITLLINLKFPIQAKI